MSTRKFIRPTKTTVTGEETTNRLRYNRNGHWFELPAKGANVPWDGAEGNFWRRRVAEGGAEIVDEPARSPKPKSTKTATKVEKPES